MSTRITKPDSTSSSGVSFPAGSASSGQIKGINISQDFSKSTNTLLGKNGAFSGHAIEVWADGSVWDTVSGTYLYPGKDFNPGDLQRI